MDVLKRIYLFFSNKEVRSALLATMDVMANYLRGELSAELALEEVISIVTKAVIR